MKRKTRFLNHDIAKAHKEVTQWTAYANKEEICLHMDSSKTNQGDANELSLDEMKKVVGGLKGIGSIGGDHDSNDACVSLNPMLSNQGGDVSEVVVSVKPLVAGATDHRPLLSKPSADRAVIKNKNGTDDPEKIRSI